VIDRASALQVSFYRPNLHFSIVPKQYGETEDGLPLPFEALAVYIRWHSDLHPEAGFLPVQLTGHCFAFHSLRPTPRGSCFCGLTHST
jgi:hypothetical protein